MDQGAGQAQPLLHSSRQRVDLRFSLWRQCDELEEVVYDAGHQVFGHLVTGCIKGQVLGSSHRVVDAEEIGHVADEQYVGGAALRRLVLLPYTEYAFTPARLWMYGKYLSCEIPAEIPPTRV